jgi:hypothetical protein
MMKTCTLCKATKDVSFFNKKKTTKDGLQNVCSECNRKNLKRHYVKNKDSYLEKNTKARREKREFIDSLKIGLQCEKCGEKEICCLDFHHMKDKDFEIANASNRNLSLERIKKEIKKCICVCANCHRKIHAGIIA